MTKHHKLIKPGRRLISLVTRMCRFQEHVSHEQQKTHHVSKKIIFIAL